MKFCFVCGKDKLATQLCLLFGWWHASAASLPLHEAKALSEAMFCLRQEKVTCLSTNISMNLCE
jgi:hypothetical protein